MATRWYDLDHNPISVEEAEELLADDEARQIALDRCDGWTVSTFFLVLDFGWDETKPPLLYETVLVCPHRWGEAATRSHTREQAKRTHEKFLDILEGAAISCTHPALEESR